LFISSVTFPDIIPLDSKVGTDDTPGIDVTLGNDDDKTGFKLVGSDVFVGTDVTEGNVEEETGFTLVGTLLITGDTETVGDIPEVGTDDTNGDTLVVGTTDKGTDVGLPLLLTPMALSTKSLPVEFIPDSRTTKILLSLLPSMSDTSLNPSGFCSTTV